MPTDDVSAAVRAAFDAQRVDASRRFVSALRAIGVRTTDVRGALDCPAGVTDLGKDRFGHARVCVAGPAGDGRIIGVVCSLMDDRHVRLIAAFRE